NGNDVGVIEGGCGARLLRKAQHAFGIAAELRGKQLQRDLPVQPRILRQVHFAHPASSQKAYQTVGAESGSFGELQCHESDHSSASGVRYIGRMQHRLLYAMAAVLLEQIEAALHALGEELTVDVRDAA